MPQRLMMERFDRRTHIWEGEIPSERMRRSRLDLEENQRSM